MYKCALFDLDGTLLNTLDTIAYYANETLKRFGFEPIETERYKYFVGDGARLLIERIFNFRNCFDEKILQEAFIYYNDIYNADVLYKTSVYDGINEMLEKFRRRGFKLGVISNKPHIAVTLVCNKIFGENYFDICYGVRDGFPKKPDTTVVMSMLEDFGAKPNEALYFGDTCVDMQTGKAAGMFTVGVLWGFRERKELEEHGADLIIGNPLEIFKKR